LVHMVFYKFIENYKIKYILVVIIKVYRKRRVAINTSYSIV
jgi:hypothetical protein